MLMNNVNGGECDRDDHWTEVEYTPPASFHSKTNHDVESSI